MILMPTHLGWTRQLLVLSSFPNARAATRFPPLILTKPAEL